MFTKLVVRDDRMRKTSALVALLATVLAVLATAAVPAPARAADSQTTTPVLAQGAGMGDKPSAAVRRVQRTLDRQGYDLGRPGVDGRFGPITDAAVRALQTDHALVPDGVVGPRTNAVVRKIERRERRLAAHRSGERSQKKPQASTPAKAQPNKPTSTRTPPAPTVVRTASSSDNGLLLAVAAGAALGAVFAALWALGLRPARRRREAPSVLAPIGPDIFVEGRSENPNIGEFSGHALAAMVLGGGSGEEPEDEDTRYLVDDARKPTPIWVRGSEVQRSPSRLVPGEAVIGYITVSTDAQRAETDAKARIVEGACRERGWELCEVVTDREAGRSLERPGLAYALQQIAEGRARGLVVPELRRLSRSIVDLGVLMDWFRDAEAALVALDLDVDTSTPAGYELAARLITLSDWERERIARRTRSGLAEVKASGRSVGRPAVSDRPELVERIVEMRASNMTLQAIADRLNAEGVPTLRGGAMWRPSSVQAALGYRRPGSRTLRDQLPTLKERRM
jgi:DNA invertase Pin-like site-specific DNA recombinase/peptidoglycan hydrolase-like protein with peptidoglycan-binding domain